jgi:uncharacterized protein
MAQPAPAHRKKQLVTKRMTVPANFASACRDFNAGRFFDAHEWIEEIWQFEHGPVRELYKGLIQIAAGFVHISRANAAGADRLLSTAIAHLAPYRPLGAMGWDVERIASDTEEGLRRVRDLSPARLAEFDLARRPLFEFDPALLPAEARRWNAWGFDPGGNVEEMEITVAA